MRSGPGVDHLLRQSVPWRVGDLELLAATTLVGVSLVAGGWWGTSGEVALAEQLAWLNLAVVGLIVLGAGNLLWLLRGHRAVGELRRHVVGATEPAGSMRVTQVVAEAATVAGDGVVAAASMTRYHRPDCLLVTGKGAAPVAARRRRSMQPCGVCRPTPPPDEDDAAEPAAVGPHTITVARRRRPLQAAP